MRRFAGEFESAPHDKCMCQRMETVESFVMLILHDAIYIGISTKLDSYSWNLTSKRHMTSRHLLTDTFVMQS